MKTYTTIDECIVSFPQNVQEILQNIRKIIKKEAPEAIETISYGIPTFKLNGNLIHFCGYKNHIGLYPGAKAVEAFQKELTDYKTSKGTIQFPLNQPIPYDLIANITKYRVKQSKKA